MFEKRAVFLSSAKRYYWDNEDDNFKANTELNREVTENWVS